MSLTVEGLAKFGQPQNLTSMNLLGREITTAAGTLAGEVEVSGATPLIQIRDGSSALFQSVEQC